MSETVSRLATELGGDLLRAALLGQARPVLDGRYHIDRILGRGATGVVVQGTDERLARPVAIKMAPANAASLVMLEEARAVAQLRRRPYVVQVYETANGRLARSAWTAPVNYIVMELVQGTTLREWQAQGRSAAAVLGLYAKVALGLHDVHAHGIAHGDVKPDNVIVDAAGEPTLVDFGFAARMRERGVGQLRDEVLGTPPYMAPEARVGQVRRKGDVHAYAVALWEALTGFLPFEGFHAPVGVFGIRTLPGEANLPSTLRRTLKRSMRLLPGLRPSMNEVCGVVWATAGQYREVPRSRRLLPKAVLLGALAAGVALSPEWVEPLDRDVASDLRSARSSAWQRVRLM